MYRSVSEEFYMSGGVPHEEVDWASLAKQWIAMQQHNQIVPSMNASIPPPLHAIDKPPAIGLIEANSNPLIYRPTIADVPWTGVRHVLPPQMPPQVTLPQRLPQQNVCPQPTTTLMLPVHEPQPIHIRPPPVNQFNNASVAMPQVWNQTTTPVRSRPPFVPSNRDVHSSEATSSSRSPSCPPVSSDNNFVDANKRKQLPAWIREGLERMEKEKQRKMEKEKEDEERREWLRLEKERQQELSKEISSREPSPETISFSKIKSRRRSNSEEREEKSGDEYDWTVDAESELYQELMLKVRKVLTELLLEVTDAEIKSAAKEVIDKAKNSRANKQLAVATPITKLTSLGGLISGYGSGSDTESEDENNREDDKSKEKEKSSGYEKKVESNNRQEVNDKKESSNSRRASSSSEYSKKADSSKSKSKNEEKSRRRKSDEDDKRKHRRRSRSKSRSRSGSHSSTSYRQKHKRHRSRSRSASKGKDRKRSKRSRSRSASKSKSVRSRSRSRERDRRRK